MYLSFYVFCEHSAHKTFFSPRSLRVTLRHPIPILILYAAIPMCPHGTHTLNAVAPTYRRPSITTLSRVHARPPRGAEPTERPVSAVGRGTRLCTATAASLRSHALREADPGLRRCEFALPPPPRHLALARAATIESAAPAPPARAGRLLPRRVSLAALLVDGREDRVGRVLQLSRLGLHLTGWGYWDRAWGKLVVGVTAGERLSLHPGERSG